MEPRFEKLTEKKLVGMHLSMSLVDNRTFKLWSGFMPRRKEITNNCTNNLFSIQVYSQSYFADFQPTTEFEKWATIEVRDFQAVPQGMETFVLEGGLYAVFDHKGSGEDSSIFEYIYGSWIPKSNYILDDRPHFELLGEKYKYGDANSEEEIWIPIRAK